MNVFQLEVKTTSLIGWLKYECCNFRQTEQTAIVVAFSWYSLGTVSNIVYMSGFPGHWAPAGPGAVLHSKLHEIR